MVRPVVYPDTKPGPRIAWSVSLRDGSGEQRLLLHPTVTETIEYIILQLRTTDGDKYMKLYNGC